MTRHEYATMLRSVEYIRGKNEATLKQGNTYKLPSDVVSFFVKKGLSVKAEGNAVNQDERRTA